MSLRITLYKTSSIFLVGTQLEHIFMAVRCGHLPELG